MEGNETVSQIRVLYFNSGRRDWTPIDNLLRLLRQPILDKFRLVAFHLQYNIGKCFLQTRVCMTLVHCSLLPMVAVAKRSPETDDAKRWHFLHLHVNQPQYHNCNNFYSTGHRFTALPENVKVSTICFLPKMQMFTGGKNLK